MTQFDSISIDIVHDAVQINRVARLTDSTYEPRGNTNLYDAIGKTIRATEAKAGNKYKVLFVTLTDGRENASSEWNSETIKELIKEKENKDHWTFAHIGVGLNGWDAVQTLAAGTISANNVLRSEPGKARVMYAKFAASTSSYCSNASAGGQSLSGFWGGTADNDEEDKN